MNKVRQAFDYLSAPLNGVSLIEASAGTGKTFSLERLVVRLIVEKGVPIEKMLLMTFTKAATAELSSRIRSVLVKLRDAWNKHDTTVDLIARWAGQPKCIEKAETSQKAPVESRLAEAIENFDDASIFTIHSFCQKMLTEYVFSRGGSFGFEIGDDTEQTEQALDEFLRKEYAACNQDNTVRIEELMRWEGSWLEKLNQLKSQPQSVREQVAALTFQDDEYHPSDEMMGCLKRFAAEVPNRIKELKHQQKIMTYDDMLLELQDSLIRLDVVNAIRKRFQVVLVDEFQDTDPVQFDIFRKLFLDMDKTTGDPELLKETVVFFVGDPKQAIYGFRSAELETYFDALELVAATGRIYYLPQNFRSTPVIIHAVNTLFAKLDGSEEKEGQTQFKFNDKNSFLNFPSQENKDQTQEKIEYQGVDFKSTKLPLLCREVDAKGVATWTPVPAFELWTNNLGTEVSSFKEKGIRRHLAEAIATDIVGLLNRENGTVYYFDEDMSTFRPLEAKDIAILVKTRSHADDLRDELLARNVRTRLESKENVFQSTEAVEILTLLRAMASPDDHTVLTAAQATRLVGSTLHQIQTESDKLAAFRRVLKKAAENIEQTGIYPEFSRLMNNGPDNNKSKNEGFKTVDRLLQLTNGERMLTNYQHLLEILQAQQQKIGNDFAGIIHWLESAIDGAVSSPDSEDNNLRIESDANVVNIVTIHASKGLEYPVVYLADALQTRLGERQKHSVFKEYTGSQKKLLFTPDSEVVTVHSQSCVREEQENVRLAYVAMTRASSRLVLPLVLGIHHNSAESEKIHNESFQSAYVRTLFGRQTNYDKENKKKDSKKDPPKFIDAERTWSVFCNEVSVWRDDMLAGYPVFSDALVNALKEVKERAEAKKNPAPNSPAIYLDIPENYQDSLKDIDFIYVRDWQEVPINKKFLKSREEIKYQVNEPSIIPQSWIRTSFSGISKSLSEGSSQNEKHEAFTFPRGTEAGDFLHKLIEEIVNKGVEDPQSLVTVDETVSAWLEKAPFYRRLDGKKGSYDAETACLDEENNADIDQQAYCLAWLQQRIRALLDNNLPGQINLREVIQSKKVVPELNFLLSSPGEKNGFNLQQLTEAVKSLGFSAKDEKSAAQSLSGYLTGEIDLLFKNSDGKYWVLDWKSNAIENKDRSADNPANYTQKNMEAVMKEHHYKLQALCYLVALYRYIRQMHHEKAQPEEIMEMIGGAMYVFLRGMNGAKDETGDSNSHLGVFVMPIQEMKHSILALDKLFGQRGQKV